MIKLFYNYNQINLTKNIKIQRPIECFRIRLHYKKILKLDYASREN